MVCLSLQLILPGYLCLSSLSPPTPVLYTHSSTVTEFIVCELCNIQVTSPYELKQHLGSSSHASNEDKLLSDDVELDKALQERGNSKI